MKRILIASCLFAMAGMTQAADVVRHSNGTNFPIARAVEVPAGKTIYFHSGMTPAPLDPKATPDALQPFMRGWSPYGPHRGTTW